MSTHLIGGRPYEVSQNLVNDCLILIAAVRRIGESLPRERSERSAWPTKCFGHWVSPWLHPIRQAPGDKAIRDARPLKPGRLDFTPIALTGIRK